MSRLDQDGTRVPVVVLILAGVIFCLGTSEFMIAGILDQIASELRVSVPQAGLLITGFAGGMIVGAPTMALLTLRLPVRATLVLTAGGFAGAHVLGALAPDYTWLMISRVAAAFACGGFWAVASVHAVRVSRGASVGRSLATLVGGLTVANLIGVPAGAGVGEQLGWRAAFWVVAAVTVVAALVVAATVRPAPSARPQSRLGEVVLREVQVFRTWRIWLALACTALFQASVFAAFSYLSPLLTKVTGLTPALVPAALAGFGLGALIGVTVGGRTADRNLFANLIGSLVATMGSLLLLWASADVPWLAITGVVLVGLSGFSIAGALNARVFLIAAEAPTLAASVNTSAFNVGNALGPALGGLAISAGLGYRSPLLVGVLLAAAAIGTTVLAMRSEGAHLRPASTDLRLCDSCA